MHPQRIGKWGVVRRNRGRGNHNQDILCEERGLFSLKKKKNQKVE